eukprot:CAMPEP_0197289576 /NCGR_PEP_ID=MMETSP0890-20130614/6837_1 /TAXON_ID=44058 ORGANISM="Aureoumbra lagunensis, Strain CCMP1510" /NCGR_SAMPLE_ID=MMETSP0890 /ASSEMBLY_ACC=CAM_ASM_000533 /LENGTH=83 /DNA_ID=CAMNT_0042761063 /DNA_START=296 /DNA_END=544 /DNA_ORIENTATION=-
MTSNSSFSSAAGAASPPEAGAPAIIIGIGAAAADASTPNVSSIFDTNSDASSRVNDFISSRILSTFSDFKAAVLRFVTVVGAW